METEKSKTEGIVNGKMVYYDGCHDGTLEKAKEFYDPSVYEYIGTSDGIIVNDVHMHIGEAHHLFIFKKNL